MSIQKEFNSLKSFVSSVLEKYPETRNSDTRLYIQCCRELGAKTLSDIEKLNLNIVSIHKIRQIIQNKEGKWQATEVIKEKRNQRRWDIREYMGKIKAIN
ncbi:hypothetical protein ACT3HK_11775 [Thermolongibacillus altinsuensis]